VINIRAVDPLCADATSLLHEAWIDAGALYPELFVNAVAPPTNGPLPEPGVYLIAYLGELPVACGAVWPFELQVGELRRMYVHREHRRHGYASAVLSRLLAEARELGYSKLVLETGKKQVPAMRFYEREGYFGEIQN
jgi:GNAT superfamily N-acetyltransferase